MVTQIDPNQRHIGLLYRDINSDAIVLLHLAFHLDLRCHIPMNGLWVDPDFDLPRLRQVAAISRQVWAKNGKRVPFGISRPNDCFDHETYEFLIQPSRHGLTCATFVLAMFLEAGLEIVEYDSWPSRPEDVAWQEEILAKLRSRQADPDHVAAVEQDIGCIRVRPEEVAGAAALSPHPVNFQRTEPIAEDILRRLSG